MRSQISLCYVPLYVNGPFRWNKSSLPSVIFCLNTHAVANLIRTRKEPQIISIQETQLPMKNTRDGRTRCEGTIWLSATTTYIIRSTIIVGEGMEA